MEQKNKFILFLLITVVILVAVLSSFGLNLFRGDTPEIVLPPLVEQGNTGEPVPTGSITGDFVRVQVTPETVQAIIKTLDRPTSYERTVTIERFHDDSGVPVSSTASVLVDGGWTMVAYSQPVQHAGTEHTIVGEGKVYRWYGGDLKNQPWETWAANQRASDIAQHLLRYEDLLDLDKESILETDYAEKESLSCIYVEIGLDALGYREKYWVSVTSGLLVCQETYKEDRLVLRTSAYSMASPLTSGTEFTLPDGSVLHQAGG